MTGQAAVIGVPSLPTEAGWEAINVPLETQGRITRVGPGGQ